MIKAVLIDVDDTILDFNKCANTAIRKTFADFSLGFEESYISTFHKINDSLWRKVEFGEMTRDEVRSVRWGMVFDKLGIDFDSALFEKQFIANITETAEPMDNALEVVEYLSKKYTLCVASNSAYSIQSNRLKKAGMFDFFDKFFLSQEIGYAKPNPLYYEKCLEELGNISPSEVFMIGDTLTADIKGGKDAGMHTIWVNPWGLEAFLDITPDHTVSSLLEIKDIL